MKNAKNVKNANYLQVDNEIKQIVERNGVVVLSSREAWEKFGWSRKWFVGKPEQGYFIWVKKQIDFPLTACATIASPKVSQNLTNLLIVEKNIKIRANVVCNAVRNDLCGRHEAFGKLVLKDNARLEYNHFHKWGEGDFVGADYEFMLGRNAVLKYSYENLFTPKNLSLKTDVYSQKNSSANLSLVINGANSNIRIRDNVFLKGENASGIVRLRLVGRKDSRINAKSSITAEAAGNGHLDCQGLLVDDDSSVKLTPELISKNRGASITHEASIGRVNDEQMDYLRTRGLTEREAIDLIVSGFLGANKRF